MRLTPLRLVLLALAVLGLSVAAALVADRLDLGRSPLEIARKQLESGNAAAAERTAARALERDQNNRALWYLLLAARVDLMTRDGSALSASDNAQFINKLQQSPFEDLHARFLHLQGKREQALALVVGPGPRGRNAIARGDFALQDGRIEAALTEFREAARTTPNPETVAALFAALEKTGRRASISDYLRQDSIMRAAPSLYQVEGHLMRGEYFSIWRPLFVHQFGHYRATTVWVAVFAGLGWLLLLLQIGHAQTWHPRELALILPALLLGALSAQATLWVVSIQDYLIGYESLPKNFIFNLLYAVLGIGLREEVLKLAAFALLIPFIARMKEDRELRTLVLASLVGLGFAVEENIGYFSAQPSAVFGRFLTANFFHMTLTGLAGRHLMRMLQRPAGASQDLEVLGMVVLLHGVYDFLLMEKSLAELSFLSVTVYIWMAQKFLGEVMALGGRGRRRWPLSYTFTAALTLSIGAGYLLATVRTDPFSAAASIAGGIIGTAVIAILFFREFNEPMAGR